MDDGLNDDAGAEGRYQALAEATAPLQLRALYDASWRVRRHAAELLARDAGPAEVAGLIAVLGERDQPGARNAAATALGLAGAAAREPLVRLLGHADPEQRKLAAEVLGARREAAALDALERAAADADPNVQGAAAEALGRLGAPRAAAALAGLLDSPHALVRACALDALFALRAQVPLQRLKALLPAAGAFRLLGLVSHPAAHALVSHALGQRATRDAALAALGLEARPWPSEAEARLRASLRASADVEAWLARKLEADDQPTRLGAMAAVAVLRAHALAPQVARAVRDGEAAEQAAAALTRLGLGGALALLGGEAPALAALGPEARAVAAEAVVRVGEPVLVPHLQRLLSWGDDELAEVAVRALGRCRTSLAVAPLIGALDDDALASAASRALARLGASFRDEVRFALATRALTPHVLRALVQVDPAGAQAAVRSAANETDEGLRVAAVESAHALGEAEAVEAVGRGLSDESAGVRRAAARAVARVPGAAGLLPRGLVDVEPSVVAAACDAAGELRAQGSAPRLAELLSARQGFVVLAALQALAALGGLDDARAQAALEHADPEVVKAALTLLADRALGVAAAGRLLHHPRWDVRAAAARALEADGTAQLAGLQAALGREPDALARQILADVVHRLEG